MDGSWKKVESRRSRRSLYTLSPTPIHKYWDGFDERGKERWYIEMSNGTILTSNSSEYDIWSQRYTNTQEIQ